MLDLALRLAGQVATRTAEDDHLEEDGADEGNRRQQVQDQQDRVDVAASLT